jgi:cell division protein ZipA
MSELRWILLIAGVALIVALYVFGKRNRQRNPVELDRPLRVDPPRPPPAADTPRLEPRMSLGEAGGGAATEVEDGDAVDRTSPPAPVVRRDPLVSSRAEPPTQRPEPAFRPEPPLRPQASFRAEPAMRPDPRKAEPGAAYESSAPRETVTPPQGDASARAAQRPAAARGPQKIVAIRVTAAHPTRFDGALLREVVTAARFTHGRYEIFHRLDPDGRPIMSLASLLEPGTFDPGKMDTAAYPGIALFTVMPGPLPATRAFDELLDTARALAHRLGGQLQDDRGAPLSVQRVFKLREEVVAFERTLGSSGRA